MFFEKKKQRDLRKTKKKDKTKKNALTAQKIKPKNKTFNVLGQGLGLAC